MGGDGCSFRIRQLRNLGRDETRSTRLRACFIGLVIPAHKYQLLVDEAMNAWCSLGIASTSIRQLILEPCSLGSQGNRGVQIVA
jgi:hypothetical protein